MFTVIHRTTAHGAPSFLKKEGAFDISGEAQSQGTQLYCRRSLGHFLVETRWQRQ